MSSESSFRSDSSRSIREREFSGLGASSSCSSTPPLGQGSSSSSSSSSQGNPVPPPLTVLLPVSAGARSSPALRGKGVVRRGRVSRASVGTPPPMTASYEWVSEDAKKYASSFRTEAKVHAFLASFALCPPGVEAVPCSASDRIYHRPREGEEEYVFVCDYFRQFRVAFPLSVFECELFSVLSVAPSQLHPNSWGM